MANDEAEHNAARMLGCEISDDPLNPLLPIMQACRNHHPDEDLSILERAYRRAVIQHSSQRRKSGEPYIIHPLAVAQILADLGMGPLVVAAGLLHDTVEDTDLKLQAQPFAITSDILWWVGDERAMLAAMRALAIDEECSLAAIVAAAIHGDQWPNRN